MQQRVNKNCVIFPQSHPTPVDQGIYLPVNQRSTSAPLLSWYRPKLEGNHCLSRTQDVKCASVCVCVIYKCLMFWSRLAECHHCNCCVEVKTELWQQPLLSLHRLGFDTGDSDWASWSWLKSGRVGKSWASLTLKEMERGGLGSRITMWGIGSDLPEGTGLKVSPRFKIPLIICENPFLDLGLILPLLLTLH